MYMVHHFFDFPGHWAQFLSLQLIAVYCCAYIISSCSAHKNSLQFFKTWLTRCNVWIPVMLTLSKVSYRNWSRTRVLQAAHPGPWLCNDDMQLANWFINWQFDCVLETTICLFNTNHPGTLYNTCTYYDNNVCTFIMYMYVHTNGRQSL